LPVLVRVTVCAGLVVPIARVANVKLEGDSDTDGDGTPVPLSVTVCGLLAALSVSVRVPLTLPVAVGAKLTLIVQLAPPAKDAPQWSDSKNCAVALMLVMDRLTLLVLVRVTDCGVLVAPTPSDANDKDVGDKETVGEGPSTVPLRDTTRLAPLVPFTVNVPVSVPGEDPAGGANVTE